MSIYVHILLRSIELPIPQFLQYVSHCSLPNSTDSCFGKTYPQHFPDKGVCLVKEDT